jgi:diaminopimelate decarboxylase
VTVDPQLLNAAAVDYVNDILQMEGVALQDIANAVGTPTYAYSAASLRSQYQLLDSALRALPHRLHYAVKANSTLACAKTLCRPRRRV